jgi:hypothetical protein
MMVMMMAITPSLKASSLALFILVQTHPEIGAVRIDFPYLPLCCPVNRNDRENSMKGPFAVSAKSYKGKIPARTGRPVLTYINRAAGRSTVMADH